jgi:hypothetical protein
MYLWKRVRRGVPKDLRSKAMLSKITLTVSLVSSRHRTRLSSGQNQKVTFRMWPVSGTSTTKRSPINGEQHEQSRRPLSRRFCVALAFSEHAEEAIAPVTAPLPSQHPALTCRPACQQRMRGEDGRSVSTPESGTARPYPDEQIQLDGGAIRALDRTIRLNRYGGMPAFPLGKHY